MIASSIAGWKLPGGRAGDLPPDAVVGMTDYGLFGCLSGQRPVNLDGVINRYSCQEALQRGRLREFLEGCRMTYVATSTAKYERGRDIYWAPGR